MEGIAYQVEAPLSRTRDLRMEERYRRLHYEAPPPPQYWAQSPPKAVALARFKRHLPAIPKKKHKEVDSSKKQPPDHFDMPAYTKHYKDKYGSVSAHSTSAIYGALRTPHYHAVYGPSNMWYASVRSLNRGCPREVMYVTDGYEWRDTLYEDVAKEVFAAPPPPVEVVSGLSCACVVRRRPGHDGTHGKSRHQGSAPRCKYCTAYPNNGSTNSGLPKKLSINSEKMKASEEKADEKPESTSRMSGYKKCLAGGSKFKSSVFKNSTKDSGKIYRKSILECDVTAYDLIKKVAKKTPSVVSEIEDSDIDDNLSDNAVAKKMNHAKWLKLQQNQSKLPCSSGSSRQIANKKLASSKFKKSQSENCIYSESHSVLVGGQRIFTDSHRSKSPDLNVVSSPEDVEVDSDSKPHWRKMSVSDESICIPDPDYDYSEDSDEGTIISCKYRDPKFTYSPPPSRKSSSCSPHNGLSYGTREISKSMSSLLSEDTYVPSINVNNDESSAKTVNMPLDCDIYPDARYVESSSNENATYEECHFDDNDPIPSIPKQDSSKYESSSDCSSSSSSGGTLSSEYPTWTSSSSNELKSILKKKQRRRDNAIQELEDASRVFQNSKEAKDYQKKKQVQFLPGRDEAFFDSLSIQDSDANNLRESSGQKDELGESVKDKSVINGDIYETVSEAMSDKDSLNGGIVNEEYEAIGADPLPDYYPISSESRPEAPCSSGGLGHRWSSLEQFPRPAPSAPRKAPRSLPPSPTEMAAFCFDFIDKPSKIPTSSRSVFYVPVDSEEPTKVPESPESYNPIYSKSEEENKMAPLVVLPSVNEKPNYSHEKDDPLDVGDLDGNLSPDTYDTDEDILENDYENLDPIYEELSDVSNSSKRLTSLESKQKSFFEGASKIDILSYLEDAKERGISEGLLSEDEKTVIEEEDEDQKVLSGGEEEDLGEKNRVIAKNNLNHKEVLLRIEEDAEKEENGEIETLPSDETKSGRAFEVERNDSGVGAETSKAPRLKAVPAGDWEEQLCADCDHPVEPLEDERSGLLVSPLVCRKCDFRRAERKEIIVEFVDTELKYGRDLRIVKEEFCRPMEIAGLLAKEQLYSIFLNLDELTSANTKFSEKLQDALDIAMEHGDEDYTTVNLGKIFLECSSMLHAFETYCVKQASASVLLSSLEKEKELLRIFLRVSQMENTLLRRMNLPAFLMVPVQRVTRYPLLLSRLHKVTPIHHKDRSALKEAQQKVELHLEHINQQTKGVGGTKIWRRISNISASHRRLGKDIGSIKLRKMALEVLNWKQDETRFVIAGKLLFTQITDYPWNKKGKTLKFTPLHALLIALGKPNSNYRPESSSTENAVLFPRSTGIRDASLVLMKEKNGRFIAVREPLYLGNCVISCDPDCDDVFEVQEYTTKEAYLLKGESKKDTKEWLRQLRYHAKDLGSWRKRRNALANIMINGMIRQ